MCKGKKERERQLTHYEDPQSIVEGSSWGPVDFRLWCKLEACRFARAGLRPAIREEDRSGRIALFVN